jgi:2-methylcitrate dehydratase PrpD
MRHIQSISLTGAMLGAMTSPPKQHDRMAAALHLLDWLGCALAGVETPAGHAMALAGSWSGAHPLANNGRGMAELAWGLGGFGSLLEMDDVHRTAILHPGPVVVPAVLACVTHQSSGRAAEAILRGYEAMIRLGRSVGPRHYRHFHNTATCGGLGAAVAAAWMLGLDDEQTQWAMAHAVSVSGGLWECRNEPGATKHLHVAEAARCGVQAALSARAGLAGPLRILEGDQGFYAGLAQDGRPELLLEGALWALHDTSFKPWPACRHAHPAIDAALALRPNLNCKIPDAIQIESYADAVLFCDRPNPTDSAGAKFSLQHAVAVALIDGPPELAAFDAGALAKPVYASLRAISSVTEDSALTARYPAHFGARVSLLLGDTWLEKLIPDAWGDSENPMDSYDIIDKFQTLSAHAKLDKSLRDALQAAALGVANDTQTGNSVLALVDLLNSLPTKLTPRSA